MGNKNNTGQAAQQCPNHHAANSEGQCSIGWCPYNRWPQTWPENR